MTRNLLSALCKALYEENPEHFEGGCGDVSSAIRKWVQETFPEAAERISIHAGTAVLKPEGKHTHVWLKLDGDIFDPIQEGIGWEYTNHKPATSPEHEASIIELHTDPDIIDDWENCYEREWIETAYKK
jgi:hypothetical protein